MLFGFSLFIGLLFFLLAALPTATWRDTIMGATAWTPYDDTNLSYVRSLMGQGWDPQSWVGR
jgi:hypothetical protein